MFLLFSGLTCLTVKDVIFVITFSNGEVFFFSSSMYGWVAEVGVILKHTATKSHFSLIMFI